MAKRKATIDKELFDLVRKYYSECQDKVRTCQHFAISKSMLDNLLRYDSYEEMRNKIREAARRNYEKRAALAKEEDNKRKKEVMPIITPPPLISGPVKNLDNPKEDAYKKLKQDYDKLKTELENVRTERDEIFSDWEASCKAHEIIEAKNEEMYNQIKELNKKLSEQEDCEKCCQPNKCSREFGECAEGKVVIEVGSIIVTVMEK